VLQRFGGKELIWGLAECVLVDGERVYSTVGGSEALVVALDKTTGALVWKSLPLLSEDGKTAEGTSYASPLLIKFGGRRLLLTCSLRHLICVDADTGKRQWVIPIPTTHSVLALMPVLVGNSVFITAPHGEGGRLLELMLPTGPNPVVQAKELWRTPLDSLQGCVVQMDGKLFGSYYSKAKGLAAVDAKSGRVLYDTMSFAKGALLGADGLLYCLSEDGWMRLLRPTGNGFEVRGEFRLPGVAGRDGWAHPVIHAGHLYLRYHTTLYCFDIKPR
jgi:outer membrane protein assembly factor BamB